MWETEEEWDVERGAEMIEEKMSVWEEATELPTKSCGDLVYCVTVIVSPYSANMPAF